MLPYFGGFGNASWHFFILIGQNIAKLPVASLSDDGIKLIDQRTNWTEMASLMITGQCKLDQHNLQRQ